MNQYPWFKSYDKDMPQTLQPYANKTLLDCFIEAVTEKPSNPMVLFKGNKVSYIEMHRLSESLAAALIDKGVKKGDVIALILPNCPQVVYCHLAIWKAGAIAAPINPLYSTSELEHALQECGAKLAICLSPFYNTIKKIQSSTKVRMVISTEIKEYLPWFLSLAFTLTEEKKGRHNIKLLAGDGRLKDLTRKYSLSHTVKAEVKPSDPALLLFSGGTTGTTEAAVGSHHALYIAGRQLTTWVQSIMVPWEDIILATIPMFHVFGNVALMSSAIVNRNPLALVPNPREINDLVATIEKVKPTFIPGVPTLFAALCNHPAVKSGKVSFKKAKFCVAGGAPLMTELRDRFRKITGARLVEGYALTESMLAAVITPVEGQQKDGAVGLPLPDVILKIVDAESGNIELPVGESGEIIIKAPQLMLGYWQRPKETAEMIRSGWLYTGDIGFLDEDGYLHIQSRKKQMIKCGGFQVWPRQVEEVLCSHEAVLEAIVAGIPDPYQGEAVKAWVVLDGIPCTAEDLRAFCKQRLTGYKVPKYIEIRESLPKSVIGKPLSRILLEEEKSRIQ